MYCWQNTPSIDPLDLLNCNILLAKLCASHPAGGVKLSNLSILGQKFQVQDSSHFLFSRQRLNKFCGLLKVATLTWIMSMDLIVPMDN